MSGFIMQVELDRDRTVVLEDNHCKYYIVFDLAYCGLLENAPEELLDELIQLKVIRLSRSA